jgi:hypothetical protein
MKKNILYLLAFITVIVAACNPLKDEINNIKPVPFTKTLNLTLDATDYALLPSSNYAAKAGYFATVADANASIAVILNAKYPQLDNGSLAYITYNSLPAQIKLADSVASYTAYTVTDADYLAINKNSNKNFTTAKAIEFLGSKFPMPAEKQLQSLTYVYFESGSTTSAGIPAADSFLYLNGAWTKIYQVTAAQYTSVGKGSYFNFATADEVNFNSFFNSFLKGDAVVSSTAKTGDTKYVSYLFYNSSSRINSRRVNTLQFDGLNWVYKAIPSGPLTFIKQDGKWIPDPTIYYTMTATDYTNLNLAGVTYTFGTAANRGNVAQYKSFNISATNGTQWTNAEIVEALKYTLNAKYPNAAANPQLPYVITYYAYSGKYAYVPVKFFKTATGFELAAEQ